MSSDRYVVEYFAENSESMDTTFVEADSKEAAKNLVIDKCGAFINIVACNKTKSSGGKGAEFQPEPVVVSVEPTVDVKPEPMFTEVASEFYTDEPLINLPDSEAVAETVVETAPRVLKSVLDMKIEPVVKAPKVKKEKVVKGPTNASLIREQVHLAKDNGIDPAVVIAWAMENVGHTKGMATGYVKAIWKEVYPKV